MKVLRPTQNSNSPRKTAAFKTHNEKTISPLHNRLLSFSKRDAPQKKMKRTKKRQTAARGGTSKKAKVTTVRRSDRIASLGENTDTVSSLPQKTKVTTLRRSDRIASLGENIVSSLPKQAKVTTLRRSD